MPALLAYARAVERLLALVGRVAGWLVILNVVVICADVVTRKFGFQFPGMGSTRLQELEWHFHMALFMLWLGLAATPALRIFAWKAWVSGEGSESATGLPWRWIAKSIMELGLLLLLLAVTAMMARLAVFLFGPAALREQARPPNIKA